MTAEIAEIAVDAGERENGVEGANKPTQAYVRDRRFNPSKTAGLKEVDADGIGAGEAVGSSVVEETGRNSALPRAEPLLQRVEE